MADKFVVGGEYTREQVAEAIGMPSERRGGPWVTGYDEWNGQVFVFANVGVAGRTGHDYANRWLGKEFVWFGKSRARRGQPQVDRIISNSVTVHIFWRGKDRSPFSYAGEATAVEASNDTPIRVIWSFDAPPAPPIEEDEGVTVTPRWRRGPPPTSGQIAMTRSDGATSVYVLRLSGNAIGLRDVPEGCAIVKIGMSNEIDRRLQELNAGFPPGSKAMWTCSGLREMPSAQQAFILEGDCLERLRRDGYWIGGEFGIVPETLIPELLR